jgi:hypothetical protein
MQQFLAQENVYLVSEAFRISKAVYDLVDKKEPSSRLRVLHLGGRVLRAR